jgi:hypothetical protein
LAGAFFAAAAGGGAFFSDTNGLSYLLGFTLAADSVTFYSF